MMFVAGLSGQQRRHLPSPLYPDDPLLAMIRVGVGNEIGCGRNDDELHDNARAYSEEQAEFRTLARFFRPRVAARRKAARDKLPKRISPPAVLLIKNIRSHRRRESIGAARSLRFPRISRVSRY